MKISMRIVLGQFEHFVLRHTKLTLLVAYSTIVMQLVYWDDQGEVEG